MIKVEQVNFVVAFQLAAVMARKEKSFRPIFATLK